MKRIALLATVAALLASGAARGDQPITASQNFQGFHIYHLGDPATAADVSTAPIRVQELSLGSCLLKVAGSLPYHCGVAGTDYQAPLSAADATLVFPTATTVRVRSIGAYSIWGNPNGSTGIATDIGPATVVGQVPTFTGSSITWALPAAAAGAPNTVPYFDGSGTLAEATNAIGYDPANVRIGSRISSGLPQFQLHLLDEAGASDRGIALESDVTSTAGPGFEMFKSRGSYSARTVVANTDYLGRLAFNGFDGTSFVRVAQTGTHLITGSTIATGSVPAEWYVAVNQQGVSDPYSAGNPVPLKAQTFPTSARGFTASVAIGALPGVAISQTSSLVISGKGASGFGHNGRITISNPTVGADQGAQLIMQSDAISNAALTLTAHTATGIEGTDSVVVTSGNSGHSVWLEPANLPVLEVESPVKAGSIFVGSVAIHQPNSPSAGGSISSLKLYTDLDTQFGRVFQTAQNYTGGQGANTYNVENTFGPIQFWTNTGTRALAVAASASGVASTVQGGSLSTSATDGFLYIASGAGSPSGTPTTQTGTVPLYIDRTNNVLDFYSSGAWHSASAGLADPGSNGIVVRTGLNITTAGQLSGPVSTSGTSLATSLNLAGGSVSGALPCGSTPVLTGDITLSGCAATISANTVTNGDLRQSGPLALIGRSANSTGNVADIQATAGGGGVMRESGSAIGFGAITEAIVTNLVSDLAGKQATGNYVTSGTGPVTFAGPGAAATAINFGVGGLSGVLPLVNESAPAGTGIATTFGSAWNTSALTLTNGSVAYWNGTLAEDNARFFWDFTNHRFGIGTNAPTQLLDVRGDAVFGTHATGTSMRLMGVDTFASLSQAMFYPDAGTNAGAALYISPRGTGVGGTRAQLYVFNTDYHADDVNFEAFAVRTSGANPIVVGTQGNGTGVIRPLMLTAGGIDGATNQNQLLLNTDGSVSASSLSGGSDALVYALASGGKFQRVTLGAGIGLTGGVLNPTLGAGAPTTYGGSGQLLTSVTVDGFGNATGATAVTTLPCSNLPTFIGAMTNSGCTASLASTGVTAGTYGGPGSYVTSVQVNAAGQLVANPTVVTSPTTMTFSFFSSGPSLGSNRTDVTTMANGTSVAYSASSGTSPATTIAANAGTSSAAPLYVVPITGSTGQFKAYLEFGNGVGSGTGTVEVEMWDVNGDPGSAGNYTRVANCFVSIGVGNNSGTCGGFISPLAAAGDTIVVEASRTDLNSSLALTSVVLSVTASISQ